MPTPRPRPLTPTPWRWQCHRCRTWYALSCTRRCLECSHTFCQEEHPTATALPTTTSPSSPRLRRQSLARRSRKSRRSGPCDSEFDFEGWAALGSWRRMAVTSAALRRRGRAHGDARRQKKDDHRGQGRGDERSRTESEREAYMTWKLATTTGGSKEAWSPLPQEDQADVLRRKEKLYARGGHDCSLHCDWPNECGHAIYAAKEREAQAEAVRRDGELSPAWGEGGGFEIFEDQDAVSPIDEEDGGGDAHGQVTRAGADVESLETPLSPRSWGGDGDAEEEDDATELSAARTVQQMKASELQ
ncbi:hypothetical protein NKR19_g2959 [Coniochaeta hoffmannii]|uniref:Uncharacterized protein n=1 Tax=Coniochaeta hoffmannii TaxID=91930 RepID=A0AA38RY02_9PEZI|nr:hypothetical protein NKR19_g2959 [Coniochaeta hoffmannii]